MLFFFLFSLNLFVLLVKERVVTEVFGFFKGFFTNLILSNMYLDILLFQNLVLGFTVLRIVLFNFSFRKAEIISFNDYKYDQNWPKIITLTLTKPPSKLKKGIRQYWY